MQHFLQGVCSTLFWFHPLVGPAARGAELTREYLCDEVAAKAIGKFGAYLRTLAEVAERCGSVSCTNVPKGTL
ncbi:peptidase M56 BlaR1, partial [Rhodopirellula maiorica SM1]